MVGGEIHMAVPRLFLKENLYEADSAFNQTAGQQTTSPEGIGRLLTDAIQRQRVLMLPRQIECFSRRQLHSRCKAVGINAGVEFGRMRTLAAVDVVEPIQQSACRFGDCRRLLVLLFQIQDRRAGWPELRFRRRAR